MGRKLPPYFLKADPETLCNKCEKIRSTCKFCECCYDCCECSPRFICPICHLAQIAAVQNSSDMLKDLGGFCECEECKGGCGKVITSRDDGNYFATEDGRFVLPDPWCNDCFATEALRKQGTRKRR